MTTLIIILSVLLLFTAFLYCIYLATFARLPKFLRTKKMLYRTSQFDAVKEKILQKLQELDAKPFTPITAKSHDGKSLYARLYEGSDTSTVILQMHGYRGHAIKDFCGTSLYWLSKGKTLLLPDQRAHENSTSNTITFGIKERHDVLCWIKKIIELYGKDVKIILSGVSMGASTVLMASELDLPQSVKGIIADCPYTSPKEIILKVARDRGFPPKLIYPFIRLSALIFGGVDIEKASPTEALKKAKLPILFIHGDDDRFVPYEMGKALFDSYDGQKKMLTVKDAGHAFSYFFNTAEYEKALDEFTQSLLG